MEKPSLSLCNYVALADAAGEDITPRLKTSRAILAYCALARDSSLQREKVATLLWEDSNTESARVNLRQTLYGINKSLRARDLHFLVTKPYSIRFHTDACDVDVIQLMALEGLELAHAVSALGPGASDRIMSGLDGLSVSFDLWLQTERLRIATQIIGRLEFALAEFAKNDPGGADTVTSAEALLGFDSCHEIAARRLMAAFQQNGRRADAQRVYDGLKAALEVKFDCLPSPETMAIVQALPARSGGEPKGVADSAHSAPHFELPGMLDNPSSAEAYAGAPLVAVVPFDCLSSEPRDQVAVDGMLDDIIECLSRVPNVRVISRLSSMALKAKQISATQIGRILKANYVVSGSVRFAGDRVRTAVELIDASNDLLLWVDRVEAKSADPFDLQDRVSDTVVRRLAPHVHANELRVIRAKRPESLTAYDLLMRAIDGMHNSSKDVFLASKHLLDAALAEDPNYATAQAWTAYWHVLRVGQGWSENTSKDTDRAERNSQEALETDPFEPMALAVHGHIAGYLYKDLDLARARLGNAVRVNPSAAPAWMWSAGVNSWDEQGQVAVDEANRALALSPYDPLGYAYHTFAGMAYLVNGEIEEAARCGVICTDLNPSYSAGFRLLALSRAMQGDAKGARSAGKQLVEVEPSFTVESFMRRYPGSHRPHAQRYCDAFEYAGVPLR